MEEDFYITLIYCSYFVGATFFSFLINGLFLRFAQTLGIRNNAEKVIRWTSMAKPALGGFSFFILFLMSIAFYSIFFPHSTILLNKKMVGLIGACTLGFMMGLADDAYDTKPFLKFLAQLLCAFILIISGTYISIFPNEYMNYTFTILWVVGLMNSINMLDNMDAITTTVALSICLATLFILYLNEHFMNEHILILIGMIAALIGFLYYNWHPSKMFMGDTGSQFLGVFLAAIGVIYFWNTPDSQGKIVQSKQLLVAVLTFIVPISDTTSVVINRIMRGQSPFVGGKDHTTHHLSYLGLSDSQVAIVFAGLSFLSMILTLFIIKYLPIWNHWHIILFGSYIVLVFAGLYTTTKISKPKPKEEINEQLLK